MKSGNAESRSEQQGPERRFSLRQKITVLFQLIASGAVALMVMGGMGKWHFALDLASHFRIQAAIALVVSSVVLAGLRAWAWAATAGCLGVALLLSLVPYWIPPGVDAPGEYRLLTVNVLTSNQHHQKVVDYIRQVDPHFVVLQETNQRWLDVLDRELTDIWPHREFKPRSDNFGIAMYSKIPWKRRAVASFSRFDIPSLVVEFDLPGARSLRLIAAHPLPPISSAYWRDRNTVFHEIAVRASDPSGPRTIVAGDLNCTPWSAWFKQFRQESGLRDSAMGFGIRPTWKPFSVPLTGLPIDHVLVGSDIQVCSRRVGPDVGSDHRPVVVEFR